MQLNETQQVVFDDIVKLIKEGKKEFLITGFAGCGKTTIVAKIIYELKKSCCFCAFTNKATKILMKSFEKNNEAKQGSSLKFTTIHKWLKLEPKNGDDKLQFKFKISRTSIDHEIIVFDECSTISIQLFEYINKTLDYHDFKPIVIYLGDKYQLPPIGEDLSMIFKNSQIQQYELTKVMRAKNGGVFAINKDLQSSLLKKPDVDIRLFPFDICPIMKGQPYIIYNQQKWFNAFIDRMAKNVDEDCVILTYSQSNVDKMNEEIHKRWRLHNKLPVNKNTMINDRVVIQRPIYLSNFKDGVITPTEDLIFNGDIFVVKEIEDNYEVKSPLGCLTGQLLKVKAEGCNSLVSIFNYDETEYKNLWEKRKKEFSTKQFKEIVLEFKKLFSPIKMGYALTIYKAQGSEYYNVFINAKSICASCKTSDAILKAFYTCVSRASDRLSIYC